MWTMLPSQNARAANTTEYANLATFEGNLGASRLSAVRCRNLIFKH